jgi:hypothetical protein
MVLAIFGASLASLEFSPSGLYSCLSPHCARCSDFLSGIANRRPSTAAVGVVAGILAGVGWASSPSLWVLTAVLMAPHAHKDDDGKAQIGSVPPVVAAASNAPISPPPAIPETFEVASFQMGKRDRSTWEEFTGRITGEEREAALWWASQRSLKAPGSCAFGRSETYRRGCEEAQACSVPRIFSGRQTKVIGQAGIAFRNRQTDLSAVEIPATLMSASWSGEGRIACYLDPII